MHDDCYAVMDPSLLAFVVLCLTQLYDVGFILLVSIMWIMIIAFLSPALSCQVVIKNFVLIKYSC